jgi:hypothetical protein
MFTMRRSSLSWLLSLLLVLVQHGAVLHELGHLRNREPTGGPMLREDSHALNSSLCRTCEGFAQIASIWVDGRMSFLEPNSFPLQILSLHFGRLIECGVCFPETQPLSAGDLG